MADDFDRYAFRRDHIDPEDLSTLGAYDDAPPPNPRFVRALRGDLMERAEAMADMSSVRGRRLSATRAMQSSLAAPPISVQRKRWDRTLTFEIAAVAILLVALIGSMLAREGGGNNTASNAIAPPYLDEGHADWMYRVNAARTNVSTGKGPITTPSLDWRTTVSGSVLAIADGVIVTVETNESSLTGWSIETGYQLWSIDAGISNPRYAAAGGGVVVMSGYNGQENEVAAFNLSNGEQAWSSTTLAGFATAPAVMNGTLLYISDDRALEAVDLAEGALLWSVDVTAESSKAAGSTQDDPNFINVLNSPFAVAVGDGLALVTGGDGTVTAIDMVTHEAKWSLKTDGNSNATAAISGGNVYLSASLYDGSGPTKDDPNAAAWLYKVSAASGEVAWQVEIDPYATLNGVIGSDGLLTSDGNILSQDDGSQFGSLPGPGDGSGYFGGWLFGDGTAYAVDGNGNLVAWSYDSASHALTQVWSAYLGVQAFGNDAATIIDDQLIARGPNGTLVALGPSGQDAAAAATPESLDFSGIPTCSPPAPIDYLNVTGDPANTLDSTGGQLVGEDDGGTPVTYNDSERHYVDIDDDSVQPWMPVSELPTGSTATTDEINGVEQTIAALKNCIKPGMEDDLSGYFSEDFFRRPWVQSSVAEAEDFGAYNLNQRLGLGSGVLWLNEIQTVIELPDGRVAVIGDPGLNQNDDFAMLVVFTQQNGTWVIDESIRVGIFALMG